MEYAVLGGGLAGLSVAYFLAKQGARITIFDDGKGGASSVPSAFLHPFVGKWHRKNHFAEEAMEASCSLIDVVEQETGKAVSCKTDMICDAIESADDLWIERTSSHVLIRGGRVVYMGNYLAALRSIIPHRSVVAPISSLDSFDVFDRVVVALGKGTLDLLPMKGFFLVKGQMVSLAKNPFDTRLPLLSSLHLSEDAEGRFWLGSTYEHTGEEAADIGAALRYMGPRMELMGLSVKEADTTGIFSAFRVARSGTYLPFAEPISEHIAVFTGLGSRGLLYSALFGRRLAAAFG
ncbi:MAG: hypothetical protein A3F09_02355 [Chlamydiae bacterium RIFCSPHIGHO2_12_FULL_49_11]|nr:MAG: hypothetical protein A3F09_02355 [Chlamydiae bacterium RIFCSPHIGHO2_12_FULL_49_11]